MHERLKRAQNAHRAGPQIAGNSSFSEPHLSSVSSPRPTDLPGVRPTYVRPTTRLLLLLLLLLLCSRHDGWIDGAVPMPARAHRRRLFFLASTRAAPRITIRIRPDVRWICWIRSSELGSVLDPGFGCKIFLIRDTKYKRTFVGVGQQLMCEDKTKHNDAQLKI